MSQVIVLTMTYNREKLLRRTIESVINQTFTDFEHIIINNGSTDGTQAVLEEYAAKDKRISVIHRAQNYFGSKHFKEISSILNERSTPFLVGIDDDDYMDPRAVETLYDLAIKYDAEIATVGSKWVYEDGRLEDKYVFDGIYVFSRIEAMKELLKREKFNTGGGGKLYRKELISNEEIPIDGHNRDIYREYKKINSIRRMVVTGEPLFYYYRHNKNMSGLNTASQITPARMHEHLEANALRTKWLTEQMPEIKDFVFYCELSFMISLYERILRLKVTACYDIAQEMKERLAASTPFLLNCGFCTERENKILADMQILL